jgi:CRP-like cAMP-binding protein
VNHSGQGLDLRACLVQYGIETSEWVMAPRNLAAMKRDALLGSPFFQHMRLDELDELVAGAHELRAARGMVIFSKGDPGSSMMAVLAGHVRVGSVSQEGREVTLNLMGPGEIFGELALLDGKPRSLDAVAAEDSTLMVIQRAAFLPFLMRHEGLVERLLVVLCDRLRKTSIALEEIALFGLEARLARLLVKLSEDYGRATADGVRITLKLSQRDLSTQVAASRESVNKQLQVWRKAGLIDVLAGHLVLREPTALRALFDG